MASIIRTDKIGPLSGSVDLTLPTADGSAKSALITDGSKVLSFATGTPSASNFLRGDGTWAAPAGGLSVAQTFRETANHQNGAASIVIGATNYEEADQAGYSSLGGITESAGVFTFPSTGRYLVMSVVQSSQALAVFAYSHIQYSSNSGVAWTSQSESIVKFTTTALTKNNIAHAVVNIADISTDRVQIEYASGSSVNTIYGSSTENLTYTTLIKLA